MSTDFIRCATDIETIDPHLDQTGDANHRVLGGKGRGSPTTEGTGRAVRGAHAKPIGVVRAQVELFGEAPPPYLQGIYAKPGRHGALIRFSSANNHLGADALLGPVMGFAIKIFDIAGSKLVDEDPDSPTFDLVLKNVSIFIANSAKHYLFIQDINNDLAKYLARGKGGFHEFLTAFLTGRGTLEQQDWAWEELFAFVRTATTTPLGHPLLTPYWSMGAVRHGEYVAKVRVARTADSIAGVAHPEVDLTSGPDVDGRQTGRIAVGHASAIGRPG